MMTITPWAFDQNLLLWLNCDGGQTLDTIMWWISGKLTWIPLYVLLLWLVVRRYGWRTGLLWLALAGVMILFADQTCSMAKQHLPKFRPSHNPELVGLMHTVRGYVGGLYGTASSHAANSIALALYASLSLGWLGRASRMRWAVWLLGAWVILVSYSRIYLGVHYPMDIFFGLLCGAFWGFGIYVLFKRILETLVRIRQDRDE